MSTARRAAVRGFNGSQKYSPGTIASVPTTAPDSERLPLGPVTVWPFPTDPLPVDELVLDVVDVVPDVVDVVPEVFDVALDVVDVVLDGAVLDFPPPPQPASPSTTPNAATAARPRRRRLVFTSCLPVSLVE
jgi:hypothetical protein